ncbi:MAG TPA: GNAT family N-acetyltransferase [Methylocella sp.]|nr:GNAT family N-acetyltransferase [Methylocella sp.]
MNAAAFPPPSLRPYLASDLAALSEIRFAAIEELTAEDYGEGQRRAWALAASDEEALAESLAKGLTLVALIGGSPAGFISMQKGGIIDQLYVHPSMARMGVATALCDAIEKLAAARGMPMLAADVSDTARPLFAKRGFVAQHRQTVEFDGEWLGNTRMTKQLPLTRTPGARS